MGRTVWTLFVGIAFAAASVAAPVPKGMKKALPVVKVPLIRALERLERESGLQYMSRELPDVEVEWPLGEQVPLAEVFSSVNEQIAPHGYFIHLKTLSFQLVRTEAK